MTASLSEQIIHSHIIFEAWEGYRIVLLVYFPGFYCFCYISSAQSCGEAFSWGCGSAVPSPGDAGPAPATRGPQSWAQPLCPPLHPAPGHHLAPHPQRPGARPWYFNAVPDSLLAP